MKCPKCHNEIDANARFCSICGYNIVQKMETITIQKPDTGINFGIPVGKTLVNRFLILDHVAKGGMGVVYKAKDLILDEIIALKILKPELADDKEMIARFKREIKVARKIKHTNVCSIYDFGTVEGVFYISMEFLEGNDLSFLIEKNKIPRDHFDDIAIDMLHALSAAHSKKIIHRDLKPSNIMIAKDYKPIIMDFGIARYIGKPDLTIREEILGTPTYMSPEQFQGSDIDQRSDIYSFGVILYELYTGKQPFTGDTPIVIAMQHMQDTPKPPRELYPEIPPYIEKIILKCLEKNPDKRYQNSFEVLKDFNIKGNNENLVPDFEGKIKILVADDDADIRKLLTLVLEKENYEVIIARNGEEAISKAIEKQPALICMDLMMPKMDGFQAAEFLKENEVTAHIPIVLITCKDDKQYKAYSKEIDVLDYITKPLNFNKFINIVKKVTKNYN